MNQPKPPGPKRPYTRCFRCSFDEDRLILERAAAEGMTITEYLRAVVLKEVRADPSSHVVQDAA